MITELTNNNFKEFIKEGFSFIDFYGEECMPCVIMEPILEDISERFKSKVKFGNVNIEDFPEIFSEYNVHTVPYFILFKDNKIIKGFMGPLSEEELEEKLNSYL